ncbi:helix-turn-helix transcriptional regulator [Sphingomonas echinoides]|uniref:helix-turn-helix transcriptional regulator n=1 Tax=Sphingomonas echinoides TaxID=59803 RepID=UPI0024137317|nr:helix-turn-helix domain-containing protein [Sphingomonas echinoides]
MSHALTTDDAAARIGLAYSTMKKLRLAGTGPKFMKLGRAVRYRAIDLDEWMAARVVSSTSQQSAA